MKEEKMYRILLVEDDTALACAIVKTLSEYGHEVKTVSDFRNVTGEFLAARPQLVLLDILLPYYNGYHWCGEIRKRSGVPILFLSSASDNMNIVTAIGLGGDDFIAKPFDTGVLVAKVQALLRRTYDYAASAPVKWPWQARNTRSGPMPSRNAFTHSSKGLGQDGSAKQARTSGRSYLCAQYPAPRPDMPSILKNS